MIKVGTRGSNLALTQTNQTIHALKSKAPEFDYEVVVIKTKGDLRQDIALGAFGEKGIFVTEIEEQLLSGAIDIAIHSMKDMPSEVTKGLAFSAPPLREDPRDVLITNTPIKCVFDLKQGAKIGTGSKRRGFQLQTLRPDLEMVPIRGNVETRIEKIMTDNLDGVVLAAAGIHRLGLSPKNMIYLSTEEMIPAPAQGALAIQYRASDEKVQMLLKRISDFETDLCVRAERSFLSHIEGSCHVPIGAIASVFEGTLTLKGIFGDADGTWLKTAEWTGDMASPEAIGASCAKAITDQNNGPGKVFLVGAGPGDTELLTLKAKNLLENCDAVVYDRLSSPELLKLVPESARKIYVGKAANQHTYTQDAINRLLIVLSRTHHKIVRLKGGDPYVFGRGGEEGNDLKALNIPFEVVPGISSAIAGLNYAGIPITHRAHASSFHVFTGHFKDDQTLDFKTIAQLEGTLVFLMSIASLHSICHGLMREGMAVTTPVAMISKATTPEQVTFVSTLENAKVDLPADQKFSPALFVVGNVVTERESLNWFESKPLFGKTALVMRSKDQASKLALALKAQGTKVLECPMIQTVPVLSSEALSNTFKTNHFTHLWFTSENTVKYFMEGLLNIGLDARALSGIKILAIGNATASTLKTYGIFPDYIPETFTQEGIISCMSAVLHAEDHVLLPCGNLSRDILSKWAKAICQVTELTTYETRPVSTEKSHAEALEALISGQEVLLPFTSSSSVQNFHNWLLDKDLKLSEKCKCFSIGPLTTKTLKSLGYDVYAEATTHTIDGLVYCML